MKTVICVMMYIQVTNTNHNIEHSAEKIYIIYYSVMYAQLTIVNIYSIFNTARQQTFNYITYLASRQNESKHRVARIPCFVPLIIVNKNVDTKEFSISALVFN